MSFIVAIDNFITNFALVNMYDLKGLKQPSPIKLIPLVEINVPIEQKSFTQQFIFEEEKCSKIWATHIKSMSESANRAQMQIRDEENEVIVQQLMEIIKIAAETEKEIARRKEKRFYGYYQKPTLCPCCQCYTAYYAGHPTTGFCRGCFFWKLCQYRNFQSCVHLYEKGDF